MYKNITTSRVPASAQEPIINETPEVTPKPSEVVGANMHSIPVLAIFPTSNILELVDNNQFNLGAGVGRKTRHGRKFSSNVFLNAQIPMFAIRPCLVH